MNILIKNADFSEVSIGQVNTWYELEQKSVLTNIYTDSNHWWYMSGFKYVAYDVSSHNLKEVKITGIIGTNPIFACFFSGTCPTTDITFANQTEVNTFSNTIGSRLENVHPEDSGLVTTIVTIPNNAKILFVYAGSGSSADPTKCKAVFSLIDD